LPFIRKTKVGFQLGSGNPSTACMMISLPNRKNEKEVRKYD